MKKNIAVLMGIIGIIFVISAISISKKKESYDIDLNAINNNDFSKEEYQKNAVFVSDGKMLSSSGSNIYYDDLKNGTETVLCNIPDCKHNNLEQCSAIFSDVYLQEFVSIYKQKLIVGGAGDNGIKFFCANLDGSNHETIAEVDYKKDMTYRFGTPNAEKEYPTQNVQNASFLSFAADGDYVYIAANVEDVSNVKQLEDGSMSSGLTLGMVYCLDLKNKKIAKIYEAEEPLYNNLLKIRYKDGNRIYIEQKGYRKPYEELFHSKTDELINESDAEQIVNRAGYLDLDTKKVTWQEGYYYGDYVGTHEDTHYYVELIGAAKNVATGKLRAESSDGLEKEDINIEELNELKYPDCACMYTIAEGFALNVRDYNTSKYAGDVYIYEKDGTCKTKIAKSEYSIIGDTKDCFLLAVSHISIGPTAYIRKEDIGKMNRKYIALYGIE